MSKRKRKKRLRIHKFVYSRWDSLQQTMVGYDYLCNSHLEANWLKTDITGKKVNCKLCKGMIEKFKNKYPKENVEMIRKFEDSVEKLYNKVVPPSIRKLFKEAKEKERRYAKEYSKKLRARNKLLNTGVSRTNVRFKCKKAVKTVKETSSKA